MANVAAAAAQVGDKLRADRCWSEALDVFEASNATAQAIAIGNAMHGVATRSQDFSDPLELRARILRLAEAGNPWVRFWRSRAWHTRPRSGDCGRRRARIGSELAQSPSELRVVPVAYERMRAGAEFYAGRERLLRALR